MYYIYGYKNKITGKWYVGQTTMKLEDRHRLHLSGAIHPNASDYNCLFHKKIREYGIENFELFVLEETNNKEALDDLEKKWIKEKHSFIRDPEKGGYNLTAGGQIRKINEDFWDSRCSLNKEQVLEIIDLLKNTDIEQSKIAEKYNVSRSIIYSINSGKKYRILNDEQYPLRINNTKKTCNEDILLAIELLKQGYSNIEISNILDNRVSPSTISSINMGKKHRQENINYPIRTKNNLTLTREQKAQQIKEMLKEGKLNNKEIASIINCDPSVVSNINYGKTYFDENEIYPLRK